MKNKKAFTLTEISELNNAFDQINGYYQIIFNLLHKVILNRLDNQERERKKKLQKNYENTKALERRARQLGFK